MGWEGWSRVRWIKGKNKEREQRDGLVCGFGGVGVLV